MTYDPQIPLVTSSPKDSAAPIQVNFAQFAAIFSKLAAGVFYNHLPLNNANQGKHASVILQNQSSDPGVTEDLVAMYSKNATQNGVTEPELFVQIPKFLPTTNDPTTLPEPSNPSMLLTYSSVNIAGPVFYSFLPGGLLIYFGMVTGVNTSPQLITLTPSPVEILTAIANPNTVEPNSQHKPLKISTNILTSNTFNVYVNTSTLGAGTFDFTWLAIARTQ